MTRWSAWLLAVALLTGGAGRLAAMLFEFRPLTAQRVEQLTKDARKEYELALAAVDKVNYDLAVEHLSKSTQLEPDNPYLRFATAQVAIYLGDTRKGAESIKFYDLAALNLRAIASSPRLNRREQQRAEQWNATLTELRQSVLERDTKRIQYGREIAKQYAKEIYHTQQAEAEKAAKKGRTTEGGKVGATGEAGGGTLGPGETRDLKQLGSETQGGTTPLGSNASTGRKESDTNTGERVNLKNSTHAE